MTENEIKEIITLVCAELKLRKPKLRLHYRGGSYYYPHKRGNGLISLSLNEHPLGITNSILHELAHHAEWMKNGRSRSEKHRSHGPHFKAWLKRIAEAWYGDASLYPWQHEYKSLRSN